MKRFKEFFGAWLAGDLRALMLWYVVLFLLCGVCCIAAGSALVMQVTFYYVAILLMCFALYILIDKYL